MEGPFDPQPPDHDAGTPADGQDDLHALLERLLGQGDARPAASGAGDELWPDLLPASTVPDDVSTIVPAAEPATEPAAAGADDIHAAIVASVSVDLEPIVPIAAAPEPLVTDDAPVPAVEAGTTVPEAVPTTADAFPADEVAPDLAGIVAELSAFAPADAAIEPPAAGDRVDTVDVDPGQLEPAHVEPVALEPVHVEPHVETDDTFPLTAIAASTPSDSSVDPFTLTPFEAPADEPATDDLLDAEALWAAAVPELDLAPELDLGSDLDLAPELDLALELERDDEPAGPTAVVLPWPTQEPRPAEPAAPADLIEAALAGLHTELTTDPVEPLRTPDVAVSTAHVVFRLGPRVMAIPLSAVSEIGRPPKITRLPHVPAWVLGIANLRGDIVSMLDLEGFFSGKAGRSTNEQRMLALRPSSEDVRTAVLVDSVDGIQALEDARISRVTRGYDAEVAPYARGLYQMGDDLVVVIDADRLLQSKPMRQFEDGAGAR